MFDVRDAMVELTGILPRGASQGGAINIARFYGREMHVLTILQRVGEVEPLILAILRTVWGRLEGMSGATFAGLTTNLFADPPTVVEYSESSKKKATTFAVKVKGMLAFAPEWEYDGQDGISVVKDYQRIPTKGWTVVQQIWYLEVLQRVALEDEIHLRTSNAVAPINCTRQRTARGTARTRFSRQAVRLGWQLTSPILNRCMCRKPLPIPFMRASSVL